MPNDMIPPGEMQALAKRKLHEATCKKWGYGVGEFKGQKVQVANYRNTDGELVAQKIRFANKDFMFLGDPKQAGLYGQHLWANRGRFVVVTEGELDALSVSQINGLKYAVVSVPNGAQGAAKTVAKEMEWLLGFDHVVFMFDNDDHGRKASVQCADLLPPGRAKIATLPLNDASDMLVEGRVKEVIDAVWNAKPYQPDGIVAGVDLWDEVNADDNAECVDYPWPSLTERTRGIRQRELVTITAGSGIGKSQLTREICHWLHQTTDDTVGVIALEESIRKTARAIMALQLNKPIHIEKDGVTPESMREAFDSTVGSGRFFLYDHFGSTAVDNLMAKVRYLAKGCGCKWIILDHLSIVVSGLGDGDERRLIDNTMTNLRQIVEETGVGMFLVSHLKRPEGKGHEDGAITSLSQLRGSHAIAQLSDVVIGLERNQQDPTNKNLTCVRVLKNRFSGDTGEAGYLLYDHATGRMTETSPPDAGEACGFKDETGESDF